MTNYKELDAIIFDFDGVLTDNKVYVFQDGREAVCCNRSDGLAFDYLRKAKLPAFIISTEKNPVVLSRAKKLKVPALIGVENKARALQQLCRKHGFQLKKILYMGNDLNDLAAMKLCGVKACPADSHPQIKSISQIKLSKKGGQGAVRELIERKLQVRML